MPTETLDPEAEAEEARMRRGTRDAQEGKKSKTNAKGEPTDPGQRKRIGHDQQGKSKIRQAASAVTDPVRAAQDKIRKLNPMNRLRDMKEKLDPKKALKNIGKNLLKKGATAAVSNPWVAGGIGIVVFLIVFVMNGSSGADPNAPKLILTKSGPTTARAGDILQYQIAVAYPATAQDITITDRIPAGTEFDPSTPPPARYDDATRTVTWSMKDIIPPDAKGLISNVNTTLSLTLKSTIDNDFIVNQAEGVAIGEVVTVTPGGGGGTPCGGANTNTTDFVELMTGQGRCVDVLGDENSFVSKAIGNAGDKLDVAGKEEQLHQLYQAAVAKNVNPLIVLTIWGVEQGWAINGTEFGCKPFGNGFAAQASCSVNTLDGWMAYFDEQTVKPVELTPSCIYSDPFIFTYEKYTPVCVIDDSNGNARRNFVTYYKIFLGVQ